MSSLSTCQHCGSMFERRVSGGQCPHCGKQTRMSRQEVVKICPACKQKFFKAASCKGIKQCPSCGVGLYIHIEKGKARVILTEHKGAAQELVSKLEQHISKRDETNFRFSLVDKRAQLRHAYALLDSAETWVRAQDDKIIPPVELAAKAVDNALSNGCAAANSLLYLRSGMTKHFNLIWKQDARLSRKINAETTRLSTVSSGKEYITSLYGL